MTDDTTQIFRDHDSDFGHKAKWFASRTLVYGALILWAVICLATYRAGSCMVMSAPMDSKSRARLSWFLR